MKIEWFQILFSPQISPMSIQTDCSISQSHVLNRVFSLNSYRLRWLQNSHGSHAVLNYSVPDSHSTDFEIPRSSKPILSKFSLETHSYNYAYYRYECICVCWACPTSPHIDTHTVCRVFPHIWDSTFWTVFYFCMNIASVPTFRLIHEDWSHGYWCHLASLFTSSHLLNIVTWTLLSSHPSKGSRQYPWENSSQSLKRVHHIQLNAYICHSCQNEPPPRTNSWAAYCAFIMQDELN